MAIARPRMTEAEFLNLPDDGYKHELVDGEDKRVPASFEHDVIGANIVALLHPVAKGIGYIASSQAGFRMVSGNVRCPDVSFTRKSRLPFGVPRTFGDFAPDLCIEIISPSEDRADMARKVREYFASGARIVWQLFPDDVSATVYTSAEDFVYLSATDLIDGSDVLPGFSATVAELLQIE